MKCLSTFLISVILFISFDLVVHQYKRRSFVSRINMRSPKFIYLIMMIVFTWIIGIFCHIFPSITKSIEIHENPTHSNWHDRVCIKIITKKYSKIELHFSFSFLFVSASLQCYSTTIYWFSHSNMLFKTSARISDLSRGCLVAKRKLPYV